MAIEFKFFHYKIFSVISNRHSLIWDYFEEKKSQNYYFVSEFKNFKILMSPDEK
jgi:hypothetical protein